MAHTIQTNGLLMIPNVNVRASRIAKTRMRATHPAISGAALSSEGVHQAVQRLGPPSGDALELSDRRATAVAHHALLAGELFEISGLERRGKADRAAARQAGEDLPLEAVHACDE